MCRVPGIRAALPASSRFRQETLARFDGALFFSLPRRGALGAVGHAALRGWSVALLGFLGTTFASACPLLSASRSVVTRVTRDVEHMTQSSSLVMAREIRCASKWGIEEEIAFQRLKAWSAFVDTLCSFELKGLGLRGESQRAFDESLAWAVLARWTGPLG